MSLHVYTLWKSHLWIEDNVVFGELFKSNVFNERKNYIVRIFVF
jgi:hypothetical protein